MGQIQDLTVMLEEGTINENFLNIINNKVTRPPHLNVGYQEDNYGLSRADKMPRIRRRDGFDLCKSFVEADGKYYVTDILEQDGGRFFFTVNKSRTRMKIFKQCGIATNNGCQIGVSPGCCGGTFVNITEYTFGTTTQDFFPFKPCIKPKFTRIKWVKGKVVCESCTGVARNILVGGSVLGGIYEQGGGNICGSVGQFVYIYDGNNKSVIGQVREITGLDQSYLQIAQNLAVQSPWLGMYSIPPVFNYSFNSTTLTFDTLTVQAVNGWLNPSTFSFFPFFDSDQGLVQKTVCYRIFPEYGDTFGFATSDGVFTYGYDDCTTGGGEFHIYGNTLQITNNNTVNTQQIISDFFSYQGETGYINSKTGVIWLGTGGYNNGYFLPQKSIQVDKNYDTALQIQNYLLLLGPTSIGLLYRTGTVLFGSYDVRYSAVLSDIGYFSRESFINDNEQLYIVSNEKRAYGMDISPYNDFVNTSFKITLTPIDKYIRYDLEMLDRDRGDEVIMSRTEDNLRVFLTNEIEDTDTINTNKEAGTKILFLDKTWKFRHKWIICDIVIRGEKNGCWYGDNIWNNQGDIDEYTPSQFNYIKQNIGLMFDAGLNVTKKVSQLEMLIGYGSTISKNNTVLNNVITLGGWRYERKYNEFQQTAYIKTMSQVKNQEFTGLFEQSPFGLGFHAGVGYYKLVENHFVPDVKQYCNYDLTQLDRVLRECDKSDGPNLKADGCVFVYPIGYTPNDDDSNNNGYVTVAKYATLRYPCDFEGETMYFELVADNGDDIEFGGFMLTYEVYGKVGAIGNALTYNLGLKNLI